MYNEYNQNDNDEILFDHFKDADDLIPAGEYVVKCTEVKLIKTDSIKEMIVLEWTIVTGDQQGNKVSYFGRIEPASLLWKVRRDFEKIGIKLFEKSVSDAHTGKEEKKKYVKKSDVIGKVMRIAIDHYEDKHGNKKAQVADFLS